MLSLPSCIALTDGFEDRRAVENSVRNGLAYVTTFSGAGPNMLRNFLQVRMNECMRLCMIVCMSVCMSLCLCLCLPLALNVFATITE